MSRFRVRTRSEAKDGATDTGDDRVAWAIAPDGSFRAALADGVSNSISPGQWADALVQGFIGGAIAPGTRRTDILKWERGLAAVFAPTVPHLAQQPLWLANRLAAEGSHATFVGVTISKHGRRWRWQAVAIGDSCVFVLDASGAIERVFPIRKVSGFTAVPDTLSSRPRSGTWTSRWYRTGGWFPSGATLLLLSDALARWVLRAGALDAASELVRASRNARRFSDTVSRLRSARELENDDATILMVSHR